jgi:hypothetical protein
MWKVLVPMWAWFPRDNETGKPLFEGTPYLSKKKPGEDLHQDYTFIKVYRHDGIYFESEEDAHKAARYNEGSRVVRDNSTQSN